MQNFAAEWMGWRSFKTLLTSLILLFFIFFLYFWNLGSLTPGLSQHEAAARSQSAYLNTIKDNPINAPHKIFQYFFQFTGHHGAFWMRSVSVLFALIFLASFFILARKWFGNVVGLLGTLVFASLPWTIIISRSAAADIMYFSPVIVLLLYVLLCSAKQKKNLLLFLFAFFSAFVIYVPGVIWLAVIWASVCRKNLAKAIADLPKVYIAGGLAMFFVLVLPLLVGAYFHHEVLKNLLLIPDRFAGVHDLLTSIAWMSSSLFVKAHANPNYIVGRLPILTFALTVLGVIGFYALFKRNARKAVLAGVCCLASIILAGLNGSVAILSLAVLAVCFLDTAALRFLYAKWLRIFPINPLPRAFATLLIVFLVLSQVAYGVRYSLFAWPHTPSTRNSYVIK
jgi:hypothetical protein